MKNVIVFRAWVVVFAACSLWTCSKPSEDELASRIHDEAIVIDAHAHQRMNDAGQLNLGEKTGVIEVDFVTMKEGGLDAIFFSVPLMPGESGHIPEPEELLKDIALIHAGVERYKELAELAITPADIRRIHESGKRSVLIGMETQDPFGGDIHVLRQYYDAGLRMITLPHQSISTPADPNSDPDGGLLLNDFGRQIIKDMNRLGMIIDITHTPDSLQLDIIRTSAQPVIASHSCVRALNNVPREIPDSIIQALAEKGGAICVTFFPGHISQKHPDQPVLLEDLVDHIDHIVELVGIDHVGFGSDFLGSEIHTTGLESAADLPSITYQLLKRGYSREDIHKILGGNLLRIFETVQQHRQTE